MSFFADITFAIIHYTTTLPIFNIFQRSTKMKIKNLTITSPSTLDLELDITTPVCVFRGKHSALALDLIRELIGDYGAATDPDAYDDGRFVIHSDIEMDGKNYNVCYIRNADFMGDNRIAANFAKNSLAFSADDTLEFLEKCNARDKNESNAIYDYKIFTATEDDRPLFVYCEDADDISLVLACLASLNRQTFVAVSADNFETGNKNVQNVFVG